MHNIFNSKTISLCNCSEGVKWGVGSVGRWICKFGAPRIFCPQFAGKRLFKRDLGKLGAKMGRPKFADPTPHGSNPPLKTL